MRLYIIGQIVSEMIGKQYTPIIDKAIYSFESDKAVKFTDHQIRQLACKAKSLYDYYRIEVFEGSVNPYSIAERQEIMKLYLNGKDLSLMEQVG